MALRSSRASSDTSFGPILSHPQSPTMTNQFEPYQSAAFQQMRARMQSLSTPPALSPSAASHKELCLPSPAASSSQLPLTQRDDSVTPSPPASESSSCHVSAPLASQTPLTEASDSSADSYTDRHSFLRHSRASAGIASRKMSNLGHRKHRVRPTLASKRLLSEGDVIHPRPTKRSRIATSMALRKRSLGLSSTCSDLNPGPVHAVEMGAHVPSLTSWRMARKQQRDRQLAKQRSKVRPVAATSTQSKDQASSTPSTSARPSQASAAKLDVLPELRLLSATRTAPIGWSHFAGASAFVPHMVEVYDERDTKQAPERQRFWPIIDQQLDHTGARMLSLSHTGSLPRTQVKLASSFDEPISPKSGLQPHPNSSGLLSVQHAPMQAYSQTMGSSDEDHSPLTPGATPRTANRSSSLQVSQQARKAVRDEPLRKASIPLSPSATLAAVIDFTRAQAASKIPHLSHQQRNAYGQLVHSPPSPKGKVDMEAHAPLRIAPRSQGTASNKGRDYFGHWETYLCNYGKESTF
ncbi:uncharacterized protein UTRI_04304_B [Ustilago trichophora]|uniref:Uncharacterized protein n=1 Tax=Ustilago trichophora TaxID=86804 RepID=A0A5C3EBU6_9BASI|nr:uncharacterized protein UTRI_04304_B [Ustilago trichophora]